MSSPLWDSRFEDVNRSKVLFQLEDLERNESLKISSILGAASRRLPLVQPHQLQFYKHLGAGSCFRVECEVYMKHREIMTPQLVAVKHMQIQRWSGRHNSKLYDGVMRELRVLTHPPLKDHPCLIRAFGYGWSNDPEVGTHPYLVVDYSDHGTLFDFLQRIRPCPKERRELALDVAAGLQALHYNEIIHGDVKPSNILVFDCGDGERIQSAKLADFGAAIFAADFEDGSISYKGTSRYNSPEQEGRIGRGVQKCVQSKELFYKADVYSFGLLLWETMKNCDGFVDRSWLKPGETELQFLDRVCEIEEDGILQRARDFCEELFRNRETDQLHDAVHTTFQATLRDNAFLRSTISEVFDYLAYGTRKARPPPPIPLVRINPISTFKLQGPAPRASARMKMLSGASLESDISPQTGLPFSRDDRPLVINLFKHSNARKSSSVSPHTTRLQQTGTKPYEASRVPKKALPVIPGVFNQQEIDLFQVPSVVNYPPWKAQCAIIDELKVLSEDDEILSRRGYACLQLSVCHHLGFGLEPDKSQVVRYLIEALPDNFNAQSICRRLVSAIRDPTMDTELEHTYSTVIDNLLEPLESHELYLSDRLRRYQATIGQNSLVRKWESDGVMFCLGDPKSLDPLLTLYNPVQMCVSVDGPGRIVTRTHLLELLAEAGMIDSVTRIISSRRCSDEELSLALTKSCQYGHFDLSLRLIDSCQTFSYNEQHPTPLHWLIMFTIDEAERIAKLLLAGASPNPDAQKGICRDLIDTMPTPGSVPVRFPEHCIELCGSPLHWAVSTRNVPLAKLLIDRGADISVRWVSTEASDSDEPAFDSPSFTPLELAVAYHLPDVCKLLLQHEAKIRGSDFTTGSGAFHYIGLLLPPFARYMIHGPKYRQALKETISLLKSWGHDINLKKQQGESVFIVTLMEPDQELYVLEELLLAGARADGYSDDGKNAATVVATTGLRRRFNIEKLALVVPHVADVNRLDDFGCNALHYLAMEDNTRMAEVLMTDPRLDVETKRSKGDTAMHVAAIFGSANMMRLLIKAKARIEARDAEGRTPLEIAIISRQKEAIDVLFIAGANICFDPDSVRVISTILHYAASGPGSSVSMVRYLLEKYPNLQVPSVLNAIDKFEWTPLHKAAYFGDHEGVAALLAFGADHKASTSCPFPIAPGRKPLDVVTNLLQDIRVKGYGLVPRHIRIQKTGEGAIHDYLARIQEVKRILSEREQSEPETT